ncbi:MAG: guanylate kinase, partial [Oscillospiraceae bacterium]|nr:guanylate kinase [Oscillospiraceae bacterium]
MQKSLLIVVSAPSGCGKGTILGQILKDEKYYYSVSATTRAPRQGEVDGVHYRFMPKEQFEQLISENAFLEYAPYCEHYYGTLKQPITDALANGKHVILEIEVQGAMQIRELLPNAKFIFIAPPDLETLRQRLVARGTESEEVIAERIAQAEKELQYKDQYDYCIVNQILDDAIADFKSVI